jgi:hypothetical protein
MSENANIGNVEDFDFGYSSEEYDKGETRTADVIKECQARVSERMDRMDARADIITALRTMSFWAKDDHTVIASVTNPYYAYIAANVLDNLNTTSDVFETALIDHLSPTTVALIW